MVRKNKYNSRSDNPRHTSEGEISGRRSPLPVLLVSQVSVLTVREKHQCEERGTSNDGRSVEEIEIR